MKRTTKYVAMDVHQATSLISVRNEGGRVMARTILPTEEEAIVEFFRGVRGTVHVASRRERRRSGCTTCSFRSWTG